MIACFRYLLQLNLMRYIYLYKKFIFEIDILLAVLYIINGFCMCKMFHSDVIFFIPSAMI